MDPKVRIKATSAAPVAIVFASNAKATFPPASRSAIIPDPTTAATEVGSQGNSAVRRRIQLAVVPAAGQPTNSLSKKKSTAIGKTSEARSPRRLTAEFLGTLLLVAAVVGSGIMAERLAGGNVALACCEYDRHGAALVLDPHFWIHFRRPLHPVVSVADALEVVLSWSDTFTYVLAQILEELRGRCGHVMFSLSLDVIISPYSERPGSVR